MHFLILTIQIFRSLSDTRLFEFKHWRGVIFQWTSYFMNYFAGLYNHDYTDIDQFKILKFSSNIMIHKISFLSSDASHLVTFN